VVADGVDAAVVAVEAAYGGAVVDIVVVEPERGELPGRHHAVLARQRRDQPLALAMRLVPLAPLILLTKPGTVTGFGGGIGRFRGTGAHIS
jgi:hypothetical protein